MEVDWAGADDGLAPGIGITGATWSPGGADAGFDGSVRVRVPRTSSGRLLVLPVRAKSPEAPQRRGHEQDDAVRLADGTLRVVLSDLPLPAGAAAPSNVRARPSDGAVRITWDPPAHGAGGATYLVTSLLDGHTMVASGSQATLPARNGTPQAWTVQRITDVGAGAPAATPRAGRCTGA